MADFPIVATGSSEGGSEALKALFSEIPAHTGAAFVVAAGHHETRSLMDLLGRCTKMPVEQVDREARLGPGHLYLVGLEQDLTVEGNAVRARAPSTPSGRRHPIDLLFRSLAEDRGEQAIGVVLSGSGSDGSVGLRRIKAAGGIAIVQSPETARFAGMPKCAIETGRGDLILPPAEIGRTLGELLAHAGAPVEQMPEAEFEAVLTQLRSTVGKIFGGYSTGYVERLIRRRMRLLRIAEIGAYLEHLRNDPDEMASVVADLMIAAKSFFQPPEAWEELRRDVVGPLIRERPSGGAVRAWIPGCSTGEEAYSLAILIAEEAEAQGKNLEVQLFATDIAAGVLSVARAGDYPEGIGQDVGTGRLERYFDLRGNGTCTARKSIRESITFAPQNLLQDPPFSHLDLVVCRDLLGRLEPATQEQAVRVFHFALEEGGVLFLGAAEPVPEPEGLFGALSERWRIFRRLGPTRQGAAHLSPWRSDRTRPKVPDGALSEVQQAQSDIPVHLASPASVTIDDQFRIRDLVGPTGDYLHPLGGPAMGNVLSMAREGLSAPIRSVVQRALEEGRESSVGARVRRDGGEQPVRIVAAPLSSAGGARSLVLTFLDDRTPPLHQSGSEQGGGSGLQRELDATRERLRVTVERMEEANEELTSSNEEIRSVNEDLEVSNNELEVLKEELQSLNEELNSVNARLEEKVAELEERTSDLDNFLKSTDIATLFLDRSLRIRWFTPGMKELLELSDEGIGRPAADFVRHFADAALLEDGKEVLRTLHAAEAEVPTDTGRWFLRRVQPYRNSRGGVDGLVMTFVDITDRKREAEARRRSEERLNRVLETEAVGVFFLDRQGCMVDANDVFLRMTGLSREEATSGRLHWRDVTPPEYMEESKRQMAQLTETGRVGPYEKEYVLKDGSRRWMLFAGRDLGDGTMSKFAIDITDRKRAEEERELLTHELSHRVKNTLAVVQSIALQTDGNAGSVEEYKEKFLGRLHALGRAHSLLLEAQWRGTDLRKLVDRELAPYHSQSGRTVRVDGAPVELSVRQALGLSLVLHELGTNAAKYGALSVPEGKLSVEWTVEGSAGQRTVRLTWRETGGPTVEPPRRRGFGTKLVDRALAHEIGAETKLDLSPEGLVCEIVFPLEN